ncbi:hypothetical protein R5R35_008575 [Gryllus longicercus]|uniref:DUF4485 domain-containing protein n=1 Tax=Gryllus longicercus TaxID=2509291 RepID=A0AAN9V3W8_9ORTH
MEVDNSEFDAALREVAAVGAVTLVSPYDRVRVTEWLRKLHAQPGDSEEAARRRNEYAQLLRIMATRGIVHGIYMKPPPEGPLPPLAESLGEELRALIPQLPRGGPVAPALMHRSPDGTAFLAAQRAPGGGVLCYMAVTPDSAL